MIVSFLASSGDPENARLEKVRRVVVANNERANMIPSAKKNQPNYTMQLVQIAEKQCELHRLRVIFRGGRLLQRKLVAPNNGYSSERCSFEQGSH